MQRTYKRKLCIALVVGLVIVAIAGVVYVRRRSASEAVRLLPECDAVLYVNLRLIRLGQIFQHASPVTHDPEYQRFVEATGFQFERDLHQAAFAVHASGSAANTGLGGPGSFTEQARFSEVLVGHFNSARVAAYLRKLSRSVDSYGQVDIYNISHEGRTVRVAILGVGTVAISNVGDPKVLRGMIDRYRAAAMPRAGPSLVRENYHHVPIGSVLWAIVKFVPSDTNPTAFGLPAGFELAAKSLTGSVVIASARYVGSIHLRIEDFASNQENAKNLLETVTTLLALFRGVESSVQPGGMDADVKALIDSIKAEQHDSRVTVSAVVSQGFISKALSAPPSLTQPLAAPTETAPPGQKRRGKPK